MQNYDFHKEEHMLGLHKDLVELHPYDPTWKDEYEKEKTILKRILGSYALDIQHVGSTSIPGLSAKPIIDIAVAVENLDSLYKLIPILTEAGYDVKNSIETKGEILARKGTPECRTHYIHVELIDSVYWNNHIIFRDFLIKHPQYIKKYEEMKRDVSNQVKERKAYTAQKNAFIQEVLQLAKNQTKT